MLKYSLFLFSFFFANIHALDVTITANNKTAPYKLTKDPIEFPYTCPTDGSTPNIKFTISNNEDTPATFLITSSDSSWNIGPSNSETVDRDRTINVNATSDKCTKTTFTISLVSPITDKEAINSTPKLDTATNKCSCEN